MPPAIPPQMYINIHFDLTLSYTIIYSKKVIKRKPESIKIYINAERGGGEVAAGAGQGPIGSSDGIVLGSLR